MMSVQSARGARHERRTAAALGGRRIGNTGRATADVESDWAAIECKSRAALPQWLKAAVQQAEAAATGFVSPRLPVVVLHELGGRVSDDLVVVPASAFMAWYGTWRGNGDEEAG